MPGGVNSPVRAFKNVKSNLSSLNLQKVHFYTMRMEINMLILLDHAKPMILGHSNLKILNAMKTR